MPEISLPTQKLFSSQLFFSENKIVNICIGLFMNVFLVCFKNNILSIPVCTAPGLSFLVTPIL